MVEINWIKVIDENLLCVYYGNFHKMEILNIWQKNQENDQFTFYGCLAINLDISWSNLSKYHFYTEDFFISDRIKQLCIQPNDNLNVEHYNDNFEAVNLRLKYWYQNIKDIWKFNIDVLGQPHGSNASEFYKKLNETGIVEEAERTEKKLTVDSIKRKTIHIEKNN